MDGSGVIDISVDIVSVDVNNNVNINDVVHEDVVNIV